MIVFKTSWRDYKKGQRVALNPALETRLVQIQKAKRFHFDIEYMDEFRAEGWETPEQILAADLTKIKGIGKAKQKEIKTHIRDVYNIQ